VFLGVSELQKEKLKIQPRSDNRIERTSRSTAPAPGDFRVAVNDHRISSSVVRRCTVARQVILGLACRVLQRPTKRSVDRIYDCVRCWKETNVGTEDA
jgi:hypothetical protein